MAKELTSTTRVAVIGGGFIGLEAAAVLSGKGMHVTVLEVMNRVLTRVAAEPLSRFYEAEHRAHGVDVRVNAKVECIEERHGRACGVRLADGEVVPVELVIVGVGIIPAVEPLLAAGAKGTNGVDIDTQCRTSLPDIYAIGDCASHENRFANGARIRLESVQNAVDQAVVAAKNVVGSAAVYSAVPWFWSNQYDLRLQTIGLSIGYDDTVIRGDISSRRFSVVYLRHGRVIALDCVNSVKDFVHGKSLVMKRASLDRSSLSDAKRPLDTLLS